MVVVHVEVPGHKQVHTVPAWIQTLPKSPWDVVQATDTW